MTAPFSIGLGSWPERRAQLTPGRTALRFEGREISYGHLDTRVRALADALHELGVRRGDRVAYMGFNHPYLIESLFACARLGAIFVLVNARLAHDEVDFIMSDSGADTLLFGSEQAAIAASYLERRSVRNLIDVDGVGIGTRFDELVSAGAPDHPVAAVGLDDPAIIMYTSGTTGRPKGAVLTHGNIFFNDVNILLDSDFRGDEVCLASAPMFHIAGLNGAALPAFLKGGTITIHRSFDAADALAAIAAERVTSMFAVPAMLDGMSRHPDFVTTELGSLRTLIVGGAPVPERTLRLWLDRGVRIQQGYGLTETSPSVLLLSSEHAFERAGSAGRSQFFVSTRVVDADGLDVLPGEIGEIVTRGPNVFHSYWNRPDETASSFTDGWFRTGDIATVDADGFIYIKDRKKDLIISGGENIYPAEVENALLHVPGVAEAAVIGVPDERWGEVGMAFVVLDRGATLSESRITDALAERLARYKQPKHVRIVEELPRTSTGKLQKHRLRDAVRGQGVPR